MQQLAGDKIYHIVLYHESCVYPLKLLDSATCDDVALTNLYDSQGASIICVRCSNKINNIYNVCISIQTSNFIVNGNIRYKRGRCDHPHV